MTSAPDSGIDIVQLAREAYQCGWSRTSDVSVSTRESQAISKDWQSHVRTAGGERFSCEVKVSDEFRERIDLIDHMTATAYEMKVSGKNPTHEFFKDVFKILEHNRDEEKEHAVMVLEWIRRHDPVFDEQMKKYLFTTTPITERAEEPNAEKPNEETTGGRRWNG